MTANTFISGSCFDDVKLAECDILGVGRNILLHIFRGQDPQPKTIHALAYRTTSTFVCQCFWRVMNDYCE